MVFVGCSLTAVWVWGWLRSLPVFPALPREHWTERQSLAGFLEREAESWPGDTKRSWNSSSHGPGFRRNHGFPIGKGTREGEEWEWPADCLGPVDTEQGHGLACHFPASCLLQRARMLTEKGPKGPQRRLLLASPVCQSSRLRHRSVYPPFHCRI